jgi:hypothetical protein
LIRLSKSTFYFFSLITRPFSLDYKGLAGEREKQIGMLSGTRLFSVFVTGQLNQVYIAVWAVTAFGILCLVKPNQMAV